MADKGEHEEREKPTGKKNPTEQVDENVEVPKVEVSEGGSGDGKGVLGSVAKVMMMARPNKRSASSSPEPSKGSPNRAKPTGSPGRGFKEKVTNLFKSIGGKGHDGEERENLCEKEVTEHSRTHLAPPEKDIGIASLSPTETMAEKCDSYDKSSSVSSAPSDYSSLPDDDDTDAVFTGDITSPEDDKKCR